MDLGASESDGSGAAAGPGLFVAWGPTRSHGQLEIGSLFPSASGCKAVTVHHGMASLKARVADGRLGLGLPMGRWAVSRLVVGPDFSTST